MLGVPEESTTVTEPSIVQGKTLPIYNGETGEDGGVGMYDVQQLKNAPTLKPVTYKTYTSDKDGNAIPQINTLPAGTSAFDYYRAAAAGHGQLLNIQSQQKVKLAVEAHKADIREKNAQAFKAGAEGKEAEAETVGLKEGIQGQAEDLLLLKAGHSKAEVARLAGVSLCSVKGIAEEVPKSIEALVYVSAAGN
jgi:hypothetical protein